MIKRLLHSDALGAVLVAALAVFYSYLIVSIVYNVALLLR